MSEDPCTVIIAAADLLAPLKERAAGLNGEVLAFTDVDALSALQAITKRRPAIVALERQFAVTPRGSALINRIKIDPGLRQSEIRVLSHDSDYMRIVPRPGGPGGPALDQRGTRRAPRFKMAERVTAVVEGRTAKLVDLSAIGAQIVSPGVLKPSQTVSMTLRDDLEDLRFTAAVAWTSFEIPPNGGPRYRAGVEFADADGGAVEAFCHRHKA
jgi:hypothetical protein